MFGFGVKIQNPSNALVVARRPVVPLLIGLAAFVISSPATAADALSMKQDFARKASASNIFEIEAARIEIAKGRALDSKQFAQDMLRDQVKEAAALVKAAKDDGVTLSQPLDTEHRKKLDALRDGNPANLDHAYLSTQVIAQQHEYQMYERYSKEGPEGPLKNMAAKMLPALHTHSIRIQSMANR